MAKRSSNLSLEEAAIERGRRYCARRGTSLSRLVNAFLANLPVDDVLDGTLTPAVRRLLGIAAGGQDREVYRRHLRDEYGS